MKVDPFLFYLAFSLWPTLPRNRWVFRRIWLLLSLRYHDASPDGYFLAPFLFMSFFFDVIFLLLGFFSFSHSRILFFLFCCVVVVLVGGCCCLVVGVVWCG